MTRDLAKKFVLKSVVLGLVSNEISWAEINLLIPPPPPQISTVQLQNLIKSVNVNVTWVNC